MVPFFGSAASELYGLECGATLTQTSCVMVVVFSNSLRRWMEEQTIRVHQGFLWYSLPVGRNVCATATGETQTAITCGRFGLGNRSREKIRVFVPASLSSPSSSAAPTKKEHRRQAPPCCAQRRNHFALSTTTTTNTRPKVLKEETKQCFVSLLNPP
jgi:hypothetical protein